MLTFTLAISCLTTSNLPWFMELTFQLPMQYCSLQPRTLLLSPVPSTTRCCFCLGFIPLFFLELFLHWSPAAYWAPTDLGSSSFSILSFCLLILFMGFSRQEYWSGLPFPSPVDQWSWISLFKPRETLFSVRSGLGNSCGGSCSERSCSFVINKDEALCICPFVLHWASTCHQVSEEVWMLLRCACFC